MVPEEVHAMSEDYPPLPPMQTDGTLAPLRPALQGDPARL